MVAISKRRRTIEQPYLTVYRRAIDVLKAAEARANGEPLVLTNEEWCAAAFLAGVKIVSSSYADGKLTMEFAPCVVSYDGHVWDVYSK